MTVRLEKLEGELLAGRFRLRRIVGKGGYGAVFEGEQVSVGRRCAVKVLLPSRAHDEQVEQRFRIEARATSKLTHPHTIVVYDFGVDEATGFLFLATEFLDGQTLSEVIGGGETLPVEPAVSVLDQVAGSLADAHSHGLVHRDVNPKNIMLVDRAGRRDFIKVIDFGIAKALEGELAEQGDLTRTGMLVGTPGYIAPECLLGDGFGPATDQYALALLGYRLLVGRNPFRAGAALETAMRQINDPPLPLSTYDPDLDVPPGFEDVFLRALEKDPPARHEDVTTFVARLRQTLPESEIRRGRSAFALSNSGDETSRSGGEIRQRFAESQCRREDEQEDVDSEARTIEAVESATVEASFDNHRDSREPIPGSVGSLGDTKKLEFDDDQQRVADESPDGRRVGAGDGQQVDEQRDDGEDENSAQRARTRSETTVDVVPAEPSSGGPDRRWLWGLVAVSGVMFIGMFGIILTTGNTDETAGQAPPAEDDAVGEESSRSDAGHHTAGAGPEADTSAEENRREVSTRQPGGHRSREIREARGEARGVVESARRQARRQADEHRRRRATEGPRERPATVTVTLIPWGTLYVDGRRQSDETRQKLTLEPGRYRMSLRQRGDVRARQTVDVGAGQSKMVVLEADFDE